MATPNGFRIPVAVLGATGAVGQRLVSLLDGPPRFVLTEVAASERSAGKRYADATRWILPGDIPTAARDLAVTTMCPHHLLPVEGRLALARSGTWGEPRA